MPSNSNEFQGLLASITRIGAEVAAPHADDVDRKARFPEETFAALRQARLLSAAVPARFGGAGCGLLELATLCSTLSQACGSSGMVLAMHYIQVGCIARHWGGSELLAAYLREIVERQLLLASITSEVGTFGDTRSSICCVQREGQEYRLDKDATTGSYCEHADGILVTTRRTHESPASDQVLVLARKGQYALERTTTWDTLGMRGTCSPGFRFSARGDAGQILPGSFADSSAQTMVPYSHILWSALWWGIAADAVARAAACVRAEARRNPGTVPPSANRLAAVSAQSQAMRAHWVACATEFDALGDSAEGMKELQTMAWALKFNNLKIGSSEAAPRIVHRALQIVGIMGYKNDSKFSLGRHYRDVLSASLMISNERIAAKSASMLLVLKDS